MCIRDRQYAFIVHDDATGMSREYFMTHKSDAPEALKPYLADTRDFGPPAIIRSDDAPELMYGRFSDVCKELGIMREFTSVRTPQLNGVAERGLALIGKLAKASVFQAKVSMSAWSYRRWIDFGLKLTISLAITSIVRLHPQITT